VHPVRYAIYTRTPALLRAAAAYEHAASWAEQRPPLN